MLLLTLGKGRTTQMYWYPIYLLIGKSWRLQQPDRIDEGGNVGSPLDCCGREINRIIRNCSLGLFQSHKSSCWLRTTVRNPKEPFEVQPQTSQRRHRPETVSPIQLLSTWGRPELDRSWEKTRVNFQRWTDLRLPRRFTSDLELDHFITSFWYLIDWFQKEHFKPITFSVRVTLHYK